MEELVARVGESGVAVDLRRNGSAPALSPLVEHAVYRVVQESLTNTIKHARGSKVRIRITHRNERTTVRVTNSAPPAASSAGPTYGTVVPPGSGNRGLIGLRERVLLIGGTLRAAPRDGGFEVVAGFPDRVRSERAETTDRPSVKAGSDSVRELAAARRSARFRFAAAFALPAGVGLVMVASAAYLALRLSGCVLAPADYAALRVGGERAELANSLPLRQFPFVPDEMRTLPRPAGAVCEFYRSNGNLLEQVDVYRLCFSGSRLISKDVLPANGPSHRDTPAPRTPEPR
ncbi:sensor histidine kinase [Embleya sp. NPDC050154]|uniref:sensor histidine kinase n=1 Tax=unclassified Embleya TaxID=2699296 RepID=UPI0037BCBC43